MSSDILLKVEDLSIWFDPAEKVVFRVSFTINKGEVFSLVGESGSGKTLTCLSLCKLLPESADYSGKVLFYSKLSNYTGRNVEFRRIPFFTTNVTS